MENCPLVPGSLEKIWKINSPNSPKLRVSPWLCLWVQSTGSCPAFYLKRSKHTVPISAGPALANAGVGSAGHPRQSECGRYPHGLSPLSRFHYYLLPTRRIRSSKGCHSGRNAPSDNFTRRRSRIIYEEPDLRTLIIFSILRCSAHTRTIAK